MIYNVSKLFESRNLVHAWISRTIRGRYQQSILGWLWAVIQPAATVLIFNIIFTKFVPIDTGDIPYVIFSYIAIVPWTLITTSLTDMTSSLTQNMDLVSKIYFPREALPVAMMFARMLDYGIAMMLLVILIIYYKVPIFFLGLVFLPIIFLIQIMLILGLGLIFASSNVFYRDIQSLLGLGIQLWFYASPIIYPVNLVPESLRPFYYLNPVAGILEAYRSVLLYQSLPGSSLLISGIVSVIILIVGYVFFKRVEFLFADIV
jgi:lipopolysaccharide transport system permease protein